MREWSILFLVCVDERGCEPPYLQPLDVGPLFQVMLDDVHRIQPKVDRHPSQVEPPRGVG